MRKFMRKLGRYFPGKTLSSHLKFYFPLFESHYDTLPYPKTKENNIQTKDKVEPQHLHL